MKPFAQIDLMDTQSLLNDEEREIRNTLQLFVNKEVLPLLQKAHRDETFPMELIPKMAELGLLGPTIKGFGGPELGDVAYGVMMQELERADSGIRSFCSVQGSLVMYPISVFGSEEQKQKYLPLLHQGKYIGCFGLTESDAGSNPGAMTCIARKAGNKYLLNGSKLWITNGSLADVAVVWAKLDGQVRGFLVDKGTPGFSATDLQGKFSLRVSRTSELHFSDCELDESQILPHAQGLKAPLSCLTQARYGIAWGVVGAASACFDQALNYSKSRLLFDNKPLCGYQLAQAKLVKMAQEITKAQLLVLQLGRLKEKGLMQPHQVSLAKLNNCKMALEIAREARDMLGANGIIDEYPVIRHMLNLETVNTYEGTEDVHRLVLGQHLTGLSAFK